MAVVSAVVGVLAQACGGGRACTLIGGTDGVTIQVPAAVYAGAGDVTVEVCRRQRCGFTHQVLAATPRRAPAPAVRVVTASFHDLGRRFAPGHVQVTVTLRRADGGVVGVRRQGVDLVRRYPNGQACDAGFVGGSLAMTAGDRS